MELCIEYGYTSLNHYGEELCGDNVASSVNGDYTTLVLADGLGSGVKANILSTLTSKILCTMAANDIDIHECVETLLQTLPVCKERGVAYSTFSIIHVNKEGRGFLFEFDNPQAIYYHGGQCINLDRVALDVCNKKVYRSELNLVDGDVVIIMSDGTIHAGIGMILNFGWERPQIMEHLNAHIRPEMSARATACLFASACNDLYADKPGDDTTVAALKIRKRTDVNIMVGPPVDKEKDDCGPLHGRRHKENRLRRHQLAHRGASPQHRGQDQLRLPRQGRAAYRVHQGHRPHHRRRHHAPAAAATLRKIPLHHRPDTQDLLEKGWGFPFGRLPL